MAEKPEAIEEAISVEDALAIQIAEGTAPPGLEEIIEKATKTCPTCGEIKGDADVCPNCGMSESQEAAKVAAKSLAGDAASAVQSAADAGGGQGGEPTTGGA